MNDFIRDAIQTLNKDTPHSLSWLIIKLIRICDSYNEDWQKKEIQSLSRNWTGKDEEKFHCLKLLRMKSFNTI